MVAHRDWKYFQEEGKHWVLKAEADITALYDYAAHNWGHHVFQDFTSSQVIINFLKGKYNIESCQALMANKSRLKDYSQNIPRQMTGLHLAGFFGRDKAADALIRSGHNLDVKDTYGRSPLWYAAWKGYDAVVKLLLEAGANANAAATTGYDGFTALQAAAAGGYFEIIEKLLEAGADVNAVAAPVEDNRVNVRRTH